MMNCKKKKKKKKKRTTRRAQSECKIFSIKTRDRYKKKKKERDETAIFAQKQDLQMAMKKAQNYLFIYITYAYFTLNCYNEVFFFITKNYWTGY